MSIDRRFLNVKLSVKGFVNEPPDNIYAGDQFIVGGSPTGVFSNASTNSIATYNGNSWKFTAPNVNQLEVLNLDTSQILSWNGSAWIPLISISSDRFLPVLNVIASGSSLPASATTGDNFLNTSDSKIYTATDSDSWNDGSDTSDGDRYVSSTDKKVYSNSNGAFSSASIPDGTIFLCKNDGCLWTYNATSDELIRFSLSHDHHHVTETHSLTAADISAQSFSLSNNIASGNENNVLLFLNGIVQNVGTDFSVNSNSTIRWDNKNLQNFGLIEGDIFTIYYSI